MLKNSLDYIPHIVLLRSDKIFNALIERLLHGGEKQSSFASLMHGVRDFYPNSYRLDEIEMSLKQEELIESRIGDTEYGFFFLESIFKKFLVIDGSKIYPNNEHLEGYISLITKISPSQLIGHKLAHFLNDEQINFDDIKAFIQMSKPLGLNVKKNTEYADNHLHLKGASYSPFNLIKLFNQKTDKSYYTKKYFETLPRINEFSYLNNGTYSIGQIVDIAKLSVDYVYSSIVDHCEPQYHLKLQKIISINRSSAVNFTHSLHDLAAAKKVINPFPTTTEGKMAAQITHLYEAQLYDKAHLLENILFFYIFENTSDVIMKYSIKFYLHVTNILRSYMIMSQNLGLSHFSEFSGADIRQVDKRNGANTALGIINSGTNYLNAKMDIKKSSKNISSLVAEFRHIFETVKEANPSNEDVPFLYNFCLSTRKNLEKDITARTGELLPKYYNKRMDIQKEALALDDFVRNAVYKQVDKFKLLLRFDPKQSFERKMELQGNVIDLSSYVVAIDAVGKETHTPPEVFAPFFRYLRSQPKSIRNRIALPGVIMHHPRLLITAHAGEDFNHIVSGMRRVAECVEYFGMERNDRIGHAISLGIAPKEWYESKQVVFLSRGEQFDNLVWLSGILKEIRAENSYLSRYILKLEDQAMREFRIIYGEILASVGDMYKAWEYRKNCPLNYLKMVRNTKKLYDEYAANVYSEMENKIAEEIYHRYHTCKIVRKKSAEVIKVDRSEIDNDVLIIYEMLQDYLIDRYSNEGIIFETNPSSNVFVSALSTYTDHPVFRFYPPKEKFLEQGGRFNKYGIRRGVASVTINSDDPAIFVTSIQNEYETLRRVAIDSFECSKKEADDWLDDIRKFGIQVFKENYVGNS